MSGLFGALGTSTRGMNVNQYGLQTSGHNIANTNTDGYSRQRVNIQTERPYYIAGVGSIGMGAKSGGVDRIVDSFIRGQTRTAYSKYTFYEQKADILGQVEGFFNEPSKNGILNQLSVMHDSWSKVASNPELPTAKTSVIENTNTFTDMLHQMSTQLKQLGNEVNDNLEKNVFDFNEKIKQLQTLNGQIFAIASDGETPNDLLDTRDGILKELSGLVNISTEFDSYGRVASLKMGGEDGFVVLSQNKRTEVKMDTLTLERKGNTGEVVISEGVMGGQLASKEEIDASLNELNQFAEEVAVKINDVYSQAKPTDKFSFFELGTEDFAATITVAKDLREHPENLVTGYEKIEDGETQKPAPGDGTLAQAVSDVFNQKNGDTGTFADHYNSIVTKNGISKQQADNTANAQLTLLNQLEYKDQSVSGVNINEEVSDVIRFSQAFQANAKVIQTISEMLDTLINRTGV